MPLTLTRTVAFRATHRLFVAGWSEAQNRERFGWTAAAPGHEHQYTCAATVTAAPDPVTGALVDLGLLDRILTEEVVVPLDGKHLNDAVPAFAGGMTQPTCEALASLLFRRIAARLPEGVGLARVRVAEDASLHADCTGPG
jgi:6-pyruvoyl-tetrahydropterin synthase